MPAARSGGDDVHRRGRDHVDEIAAVDAEPRGRLRDSAREGRRGHEDMIGVGVLGRLERGLDVVAGPRLRLRGAFEEQRRDQRRRKKHGAILGDIRASEVERQRPEHRARRRGDDVHRARRRLLPRLEAPVRDVVLLVVRVLEAQHVVHVDPDLDEAVAEPTRARSARCSSGAMIASVTWRPARNV